MPKGAAARWSDLLPVDSGDDFITHVELNVHTLDERLGRVRDRDSCGFDNAGP